MFVCVCISQEIIATHCNTLQHTVTRCNTFVCARVCMHISENIATYCNNTRILQQHTNTATHCRAGQGGQDLIQKLIALGKHSKNLHAWVRVCVCERETEREREKEREKE